MLTAAAPFPTQSLSRLPVSQRHPSVAPEKSSTDDVMPSVGSYQRVLCDQNINTRVLYIKCAAIAQPSRYSYKTALLSFDYRLQSVNYACSIFRWLQRRSYRKSSHGSSFHYETGRDSRGGRLIPSLLLH